MSAGGLGAPDALPRLDGPSGQLARVGPATRRTFELVGRRGHATGNELRGLERVRLGRWTLDRHGAPSAPASLAAVGPARLERELTSAAGSLVETVILAADLPALVVQWRAPSGAASASSQRWTVRHEEGPVRGGAAGFTAGAGEQLRAFVSDGSEVAFHPDDPTLKVTPAAGGATLVLIASSGASGHDPRPPDLDVLQRRARLLQEELSADTLQIRTGARTLDRALGWATLRVAHGAGPLGLERALGALALGLPRVSLRALKAEPDPDARLLLACRTLQWSGDTGLVEGIRAGAAQLGTDPGRRLTPLARAARLAASEVHEALGERERARTLAEGAGADRPARSLPMLGHDDARADSTDDAEALALAGLRDRSPKSGTGGARADAFLAWALLQAGDPDEGLRRFRALCSQGFRESTGLWPDGVAPLLPAAWTFGLLGARADAMLQRATLAPRIPGAVASMSVTGLRVGDARLDLEFERSGNRHVFRLEQRSGRTPITLVFRPEIAGGIARSLVDGEAVDLETELRDGRTAVRVQLPLDRARQVTVVRH